MRTMTAKIQLASYPGLVGMSYGFFLSTVCSTTADAMKLAIRFHISIIIIIIIIFYFFIVIIIVLDLIFNNSKCYETGHQV